MPMYCCRWPNGEFSIVSAKNRAEAVLELDEWGNADDGDIWKMESCMFDFRLNLKGEIEVCQLGEVTYEEIMTRCYPDLDDVLVESGDGEDKASRAAIRKAVRWERTRLWSKPPRRRRASTELGRDIQDRMNCPKVMADRAVKEMQERILDKPIEGKPN